MKKIIFIILVIPFAVSSTELNKEYFSIEWGRFEELNLSHANRYLQTTLPSYLYSNFPKDLKHYPNSDESTKIYLSLIEEKRSKLISERFTLLKQRDEFLFNPNTNEKTVELNKKSIDKKNSELDELDKIRVNKLEAIKALPIKFSPDNIDNLKDLQSDKVPLYIKNNSVDYYIHGVLEELESEIFIKVLLFSKYLEEPKVLWTGIGSSDEILSYKDEILTAIIKEVTSELMVRYYIQASPDDALIYVNSEFKALDSFTGYGLLKDSVEIKVLKEGYSSVTYNQELTTENNLFKIDLKEDYKEMVKISTKPSGAMVYYGSKYIGVTPMEIPKYSYPLNLRLSLDGYLDKKVLIDLDSKDMNIDFNREYMDTELYLKNHKEKFYVSTAIFSISLALPLYFNSQNDILSSDVRSNLVYLTAGNAIIWGANLFYRLYRYLEAAKLSVN